MASGNKLSYQDLYNLATQAGFSGGSALTVAAIAEAESGGNPSATHKNSNGSTDYGVLQINSVHFGPGGTTEQAALDPLSSFKYAYTLSKGGTDFHPWTTYNSDAYAMYMPNKQAWTPYNSQKAYKNGAPLGNDPQTGKPFKTSNSLGKPEKNTTQAGKDNGNIFQQLGGDFNNAVQNEQKGATDRGKAIGVLNPDGSPNTSGGGGIFSGLKNVPMRILKVLTGLLLIGGAFLILIIPPVKDALIGQSKPLVKKSIKMAVFS